MADILDLLSDNSSNQKSTSGKKGGFLNALKKNSLNEKDSNLSTFGIYKSEEKSSDKKEYELEESPEKSTGGFVFKNNQDDSSLPNTGNDFYKHSISHNIDQNLRSRTSIGFYQEKHSGEDKQTTETFGLGRRRTQMVSNANSLDNSNRNSYDINEPSRSPDNNRNRINRRTSNIIGLIKEIEKDGDDDFSDNNSFIPSLSNNSRRARGQSILNNFKENSSPPKDEFNLNKIAISDDLSDITFKKESKYKNDNIKEEIATPKTLLKSFKISPTNQDKRENILNNKLNEKDNLNQNERQNYKSFNKQETVISFGGFNNTNKDTIENETARTINNEVFKEINPINLNNDNSDNFKLKLEKEHLESQVKLIKQKCEEDKKRSEELLSEDREKFRKKEQENCKYLEELRAKHREEINNLEEKHKLSILNLNEENKKIRMEIDKEIQEERERLKILHQSDLESQENIFNKNLEQQKKFFEEQNETLKKQLKQQIEFNKLANKVEISSKQIDDILNKFYQEKDSLKENEKISLEGKEKYLIDLEDKLREQEKSLTFEKEEIIKMRKDFELRELEKKKESQDEKIRIEKEILRLQELQNSLKIMEYNAKEKYERERLELTQKQAEMKIEVDSLKNEYSQRLNELEYQTKILGEEKKFFEKSKEETLKNIEVKRSDLENKKKVILEEEKERRQRIKVLEEKEFFLREKFEEYEKLKINIDEAKKKNDKDTKDCQIALSRIIENIKTLDEREKKLEKEKEEIMKRFSEFENEKAFVNSEKIKLEQAKSELRLRMQSIEALRMKYVTSTIANPPSSSTLPQYGFNFDLKGYADVPLNIIPNNTNTNFFTNKTSSNFQNNINLIEKIDQIPEGLRVSKSISNTSLRKSFNAEEYIYNLKLKMGSSDYNPKRFEHESNNNFAQFLAKEKEYLKNQSKGNSHLESNLNNFNQNIVNQQNIFENNQNQKISNINNPNLSLNIFETISANMNKDNLGSQNNFFSNSVTNLNNITSNKNLLYNNQNFTNKIYGEEKDNNFEASKDINFNNENKEDFKSFCKDTKENLIPKADENINVFNKNIGNIINNSNLASSDLLTSSINTNNNFLNGHQNKEYNVISNHIGVKNNHPNKKKNMFDDIEEIGELEDIIHPNNNIPKNKNESDFDI